MCQKSKITKKWKYRKAKMKIQNTNRNIGGSGFHPPLAPQQLNQQWGAERTPPLILCEWARIHLPTSTARQGWKGKGVAIPTTQQWEGRIHQCHVVVGGREVRGESSPDTGHDGEGFPPPTNPPQHWGNPTPTSFLISLFFSFFYVFWILNL